MTDLEQEELQLSVKDRLRMFEGGSAPPKAPPSKPPVAPKPSSSSVAPRASPAQKGSLASLSTTSALNKHLASKQTDLLDEQSPTSSTASDLLRPLQPTISPQPSRPSTPASASSLNSIPSSATPPPLPSRKASVSTLLQSDGAARPPPSLPPRKSASLQSSPAKSTLSAPIYPPSLPPRKKTTDSWMEITHADVPGHSPASAAPPPLKPRPVDPKSKDKLEKLFDAQLQKAPESWTERDRLPGKVVRVIWNRSGCSQSVLADVWRDCDVHQKGSLDRAAFVKGTWAVDLERRQLRKLAS